MRPVFHQVKEYINRNLDVLLKILDKREVEMNQNVMPNVTHMKHTKNSTTGIHKKTLPEKYYRELVVDLKAIFGMND